MILASKPSSLISRSIGTLYHETGRKTCEVDHTFPEKSTLNSHRHQLSSGWGPGGQCTHDTLTEGSMTFATLVKPVSKVGRQAKSPFPDLRRASWGGQDVTVRKAESPSLSILYAHFAAQLMKLMVLRTPSRPPLSGTARICLILCASTLDETSHIWMSISRACSVP